jgi:hemin uptake protein HemP
MTVPEASRPEARETPGASRLRLSSRDLFRGQREIVILHGGHEYLLRITRADKLILTK